MTVKNDYDIDFYKKYGFASCFECDETFVVLDELNKHQEQHLLLESKDSVPIIDASIIWILTYIIVNEYITFVGTPPYT